MFNAHPIGKHIANETFKDTLWQARKAALLSKLFGKSSCLKRYEEVNSDKTLQKRYLGVVNIQVDKITGTLGRHDDFDGRFRPLKNHLRERWVNIAVRAQYAGWPPIELLQVGEEYFVVDGHHRTSYARSTGMAFIDAEVWEIEQEPLNNEIKVIDAQKEMFTKPVPANGALVQKSGETCCMVTTS